MIVFPCRCGHVFQEPDDAASSVVQCPRCQLFTETPSATDSPAIGLDGTYLLEPRPSRGTRPHSADDPAASIIGLNDQVEPIDLASEAIEVAPAGEPQFPAGELDGVLSDADGLVRPIPLVPDRTPEPTPPIPFAKPAVGYESIGPAPGCGIAQPMLELVRPLNLLVLFFVMLVHLMAIASIAALMVGLYIVVPILAALSIAILAHYGNVIDEIGVEQHDELPRVMRDLRLHEDVFWPFARGATALLLCFGPAIGAFYLPVETSFASSLAVALALPGTFFFPAILLTLQTSGSIANLRPDRVMAVIRISGQAYRRAAFTFVLAILPYLGATVSLCVLAEVALPGPAIPSWVGRLTISLPLLWIGVFVMHVFCWELGMIYRADGERFPWVGRYHVREKRPPVIRRKPRYTAGESNPNPTLLQSERDKTFRDSRRQ